MLNKVIIKSSTIELGRRILKILRFGKSDIQTPIEVSPAGIDANPIKEMTAIYGKTSDGKPFILGYINSNQLADYGEVRLYCTNENGEVQFYTWLKKNGTLELGGNAHNLVRYTPLNAGLQSLKNAMNVELTKIQTSIAALGGAYAKVDVSVNIEDAKINEIKSL